MIKEQENYPKIIDNETTIYYYIVKEDRVVKVTYDIDLLNSKKYESSSNNVNKENELNEQQEKYERLNSNQISNEHDKTYRSILSNKKDVVHIMNQVLNLEEKIKQEELEKYKSSFVTSELKNKEADVVYKMKGKNIFFLIEHQSKVDYSMPYRIEEYRLEIIRSVIDVKKVKNKGYEMPEVIPIVIYTGKGSWNANLYLHAIQDERFKKVNLQRYNLIDINKYEKETLLNSDYLIDKMFLIEKAKDGEEARKAIEQVVIATKDEEDKKMLIRLIQMTSKGRLYKNELNELINKGEDKVMEAALEMITQEAKKEAVKETIKNIIYNMLQKGIEVDEIKELTGVTEREIEQIKKQFNQE